MGGSRSWAWIGERRVVWVSRGEGREGGEREDEKERREGSWKESVCVCVSVSVCVVEV